MTLRLRLLLTSLAVVIPLAIALFFIDDRLRAADQLERLTSFAQTEIQSGVYDRCVATAGLRGRPARGGGPGAGPGRGQGLGTGPGSRVQGPGFGSEVGPGSRVQGPGFGSEAGPGSGPEFGPEFGPGSGPGAGQGGRPRPGRGREGRGGRLGRSGGPPQGLNASADATDGEPQDQSAPQDRPLPPPPPPPGEGDGPGGAGGRGGRPGSGGRPYDLISYGADFTPAGRNMPAIDPVLQQGLATGDYISTDYVSAEGRGLQLAVWMKRTDPYCAVLVLRMPPRRGEMRDRLVAMALIVFSVITATWLAAGPVLRRLGKLTNEVRRSADSRYETPVPVDGRDEVARLATAFNDAGARVREHIVDVQQREEYLRQFVANTAHDVGLPLTVLQGHLAEIETATCKLEVRSNKEEVEVGRDKDEVGAEGSAVRAAIAEAHYLGSLIRNLSAATRLDAVATPLVTTDVDINALVDRVVARHRVVARARGVEVNFAVPETAVIARAEVTLLEQAVGNLVDNAIRYNHDGGHVAVVLDTDASGFALSVTDDGPGVPEAALTRLTERWYRGDEARTRRPDGQGLGLAIAAESLKRLSFSLTFSRPPDGGLRAEIRSQKAGS